MSVDRPLLWLLGGAALVAMLWVWFKSRGWRSPMREGIERSRGFPLRMATVKADGMAMEPLDRETQRVRLDLTVRPRAGNSRLRPWWPDELRFSPDVGREVKAESIEQKVGEEWKPFTAEELIGEHIVRLKLVLPERVKQLTVRYFMEELALIEMGSLPLVGEGRVTSGGQTE